MVASALPPRATPSRSPWAFDPFRSLQMQQRKSYPKKVWVCVGTFIAILVFLNIIHIIRVQVRKRALAKTISKPLEGEPVQPSTRKRASIRNLPRAVEAAFKILAFRWTLPYGLNYVISLSELAIGCLYIGVILTWSLINSHGAQPNFWNQRMATIAYYQMPLLPLLSGKNNLIGFVTGLSYEKINIIHRTVGRTVFILFMCHSFNKLSSFSRTLLVKEKYYTGALAATAIGAIFLMSLRPVRTHAFEFFLILHIVLISVFLAGSYYHQPEDSIVVWLVIGFWLFDRFLRLFHLLSINQGKPKCTDAIVEVISPNAVRLTLPNRDITWKAGQHAFLILPGVSTVPFESHPFTIATIPSGNGHSDLVFYIRSMDGFTRKLDDYAQKHDGQSVTALVDGPYGRPPPVNTFSTVVLVAGGSGVSFTVPLLLDIVSAARRNETPVKRVVFIWTLRDSAEVKWAAETLSEVSSNVPSGLNLDIRIHLTRADSLVSSLDRTDEEKSVEPESPVVGKKGSADNVINDEKVGPSGTVITTAPADDSRSSDDHVLNTSSGYKTVFGRPNIKGTIQEEIEASSGPILVTAAGPAPLTKAVRASVRTGAAGPSAAFRGEYPVSMYIENFGAVRSK